VGVERRVDGIVSRTRVKVCTPFTRSKGSTLVRSGSSPWTRSRRDSVLNFIAGLG
jgi:hypothetical protein